MKSWSNRHRFHADLHDALGAQSSKIPPTLPDELSQWLAQLTLLYGVPMEYLVPDHRMLPVESIRFFYLDRNWLDRLVDGALSVGVLSTKEQVFNRTFFQDVYQQVDTAQRKVRSVLREEPVQEPTKTGGTMSGLLMRSRVVTDYPGVEVNAYDENDTLLKILRMDRLSGGLLLCIFQGVPVQVDFIQPSEGLHFGVQADPTNHTNYTYLRGLGFPENQPQKSGKGYEAGIQIEKTAGSGNTLTAEVTVLANGVVDIMATKTSIETVLQGLNPDALEDPTSGKNKLTAGGFAVEMIVTAGKQSYRIKDENGAAPPAC